MVEQDLELMHLMGVELPQKLVGVKLVQLDKSQSHTSSPSKTYTCTILLNITNG